MKRILFLVVFIAATPLLGYSQTEQGTKTGGQGSAVEQALIQLNQELNDAAVRKDKAVFEKVAIDRYVFVNPGGGIQERGVATEGPNIESLQTENVVVRIDGDTAVVTGNATVKGKFADGTDISGPYSFMRVFVKRNGQWRYAAMSAVKRQQSRPTPAPTPTP
jgi:ketosteroid isomerase-like protein